MPKTDLDKRYRELFPESKPVAPVTPVAPVADTPKTTTDLDKRYQEIFGSKEKVPKVVEEAPKLEVDTIGKISTYAGPDIVDRRKEPFWRKAAKFVLPKKMEEIFGLDKPMPEKTIGQKIMEGEKNLEEYYGKGEDLIGGIKTFGEGLTKLPKTLASGILQLSQGLDGPDALDPDWADRFIEDANMDLNKFIYETQEKYRDKILITGFPLKVSEFAELPQTLAFSLISMGTGLAVGGPIGLVAPFTGPAAPAVMAAAWTLGTAASGAAAYQMTTYQIMQTYLEAKNEETIEEKGREMTPEEQESYRIMFAPKAMEYGLWEAVPEAISNLAFAKILTAPLLRMGINKTIVGRMITKLAVIYPEEFLTETITQKGQAKIEVGAGLREEDIDWIQAFKEIAPQTFLLTTVMAGAGSVVIKTKNVISKAKESLKKEIGPDHPKFEKFSKKIEEKIVSDRAEIEKAITPEQVTPEEVIKPKEVEPETIFKKVKDNIAFYLSFGIGYEGNIQPQNAALRDLEKYSKEQAIIDKTQKQVQEALDSGKIEKNPDGTINLYRGIGTKKEGFVSASYSKERAQGFAEHAGTEVIDLIAKPKDIKIFIGGKEGEVLINLDEVKQKEAVKPKAIPKELEPLAKRAKEFKSIEEFEKGFIETITKSSVFKEALGHEAYKMTEPGKPDVRVVPAIEKFSDALKAVTEGRDIALPQEWTGKVLTELSGLNLEKTLLRIERGLDIIKKESPILKTFYTQATKGVEAVTPTLDEVALRKFSDMAKKYPNTPEGATLWWKDVLNYSKGNLEQVTKLFERNNLPTKDTIKMKEAVGKIAIKKEEVKVKPEAKLPEELPEAVTLRAEKDWTANYAEKYRELENESMKLVKQIKAAKAAEKPELQAQKDKIDLKQKKIEEDYLNKWKKEVKPVEIKPKEKPAIEVKPKEKVKEIVKEKPKKKEEVKPKVKVEETVKEAVIPKPEKKENLPQAHLTAKKAMTKSSTLPILEGFLVKNGKLTATDLEIAVRLNTDLKDGAYKIVGKEAVKADFPVKDFPIAPKVEGKLVGKMLSDNLADVLKLANLSKSKDTEGIRPEIAAVLLEIKNKRMTVVSTDSFRLFRKTVSIKSYADVEMLIEATKLPKILADMKSSIVEIYNDKEMVHFRGKFGDISVKKIEGEFPKYQMLYPEIDKRYAFNRKQFLDALKEIKPFVDRINKVTLTYKDGNLELSAENKEEKISKKITISARKKNISKINAGSPNDGVIVMEIRGDEKPEADRFSFNVKYLIDAVTSLEEERIFIYSTTDIALGINLFSETEELKSVAKPKGITSATIGKFREGEEVELANMDKVRPIEFPELVELTRDLMGRVPEVSKRLRRALGKFYATEKGRIKLTPEIFKDEATASKVLAHEIGHLVDYLPHQTLKRGNLLGSLLSLRGFLNSTFGVEGALDLAKIRNQATREVLAEENIPFGDLVAGKVTQETKDKIKTRYNQMVTETGAMKNAEIREELKGVTKYWRPYEEAESTPSYISYRNSSRELYADAISVLFNSPGTLERLAPKFYKEFFNALDAKPEVKNAYFDIQEVLSHDRATLIALRRERTREMFDRADYKSDELQKVKEEERKIGLKDYWNKFTYAIRSINQPIYNKVSEAEAKGEHIPDDENPKYLLSARNYLAGQIKAEFEENVSPVMEDLEKHGIDWKTFGEFLLYERITEGDRSEFANPGGIMPRDAKQRIASLKTAHGENFSAIETNAAKFRKFLKDVGERAYKAELFSKDMFDLIKGNEKYVPFQVVEYMDHYVSWKSKAQVGTLKDVNNPANSLILKVISTIRAIENQKNKVATFKMLERSFPKEIKEAELQFTGRAQRPVESRDIRLGMVTYYEDGKLRGKYVDKYIAKGLEKDSIARNKAVMTVLSPISFLNRKLFRPLFVIYNPGWIPFNFIRDYMRFWKNTPGLSFIGATKRYGQAFRASRVRAFGEKEGRAKDAKARELIRKLEKSKLLSVTWNDILSGQTYEDVQIEAVMQKIGLAESKKEIPAIYKPFEVILRKTKIINLIQGIRKMGDLVETLPKIAGYYELQGKMKPNEMHEFIRKNIGSPDFFEKGYLTPATNNIFLFSNAFIQAVTSDAQIATNPTTRSGFWWKTAKTIYLPKIIMFAALMGAFGDDIKKLYEDASEYDMTNYLVVPLGRDTNSGKTTYLRIPVDETSRLLGGVLWKVMRSSSNDQKFGRDIADLASLFGGQLPSISPSIQAPLNVFQFAAGQNPYDSFRGRLALTEEQMQAGGWYALKPFLTWQFQQMGGGIFVKMYAGEQIPREESAGEKFLQLPVLSNVVGRFVKISDYGQLEKYRAKMYEVKGEKARERIDEDKIINDYIKKYQEGKGEFHELSQDLILDVLGHAISNRKEKLKSTLLRKKFKISIEKGKADPKINALISAVSNDEKVTLMRVYKEIMSEKDFVALRTELLKYKIISTNVLRELNKPFQP